VVVAHVPACALRLWFRVLVSVARFECVVNRIDSGASPNYKDSFHSGRRRFEWRDTATCS